MTLSNIELAADSVLGVLLHHYTPQSIVRVQAAHLQADDFHGRARILYRAILRLHKDGSHVDPITVEAFLTRHSKLTEAGGRAYMELLYISANPGALVSHAKLVAYEGRFRRWQHALEAGLRAVEDRDEDAFWEAVGRVKQDVLPGELRVVAGGKEAAA